VAATALGLGLVAFAATAASADTADAKSGWLHHHCHYGPSLLALDLDALLALDLGLDADVDADIDLDAGVDAIVG
jgi:hypothetical protein